MHTVFSCTHVKWICSLAVLGVNVLGIIWSDLDMFTSTSQTAFPWRFRLEQVLKNGRNRASWSSGCRQSLKILQVNSEQSYSDTDSNTLPSCWVDWSLLSNSVIVACLLQGFTSVWAKAVAILFRANIWCLHQTLEIPTAASVRECCRQLFSMDLNATLVSGITVCLGAPVKTAISLLFKHEGREQSLPGVLTV